MHVSFCMAATARGRVVPDSMKSVQRWQGCSPSKVLRRIQNRAHYSNCDNVVVLLIDRRSHPIFQPLLYQVATAVLSSAEIAAPIRELEIKQRNLSVLLAEVTAISAADRTLDASLPGGEVRKIAFDFLIVATGMRPS
jgi:NADH dehydrogenase FAD-containing subunit